MVKKCIDVSWIAIGENKNMTYEELSEALVDVYHSDKMRITMKSGEVIDTKFVNAEWYDADTDENVADIFTTGGIFDGYEFESIEPLNSDGSDYQ